MAVNFKDIFTTYNVVKPPKLDPITFEEPDEDIYDFTNLPEYQSVDWSKYYTDLNPFTEFVDEDIKPKKKIVTNLKNIDIEDLLKREGITSVNGKQIKFGNKALRTSNIGSKTSNHRRKDPDTGNAMARDISIVGGTTKDYQDFMKILISNENVKSYMSQKGWGIINEITPEILSKTGGTGPHFHFGPDTWAVRTWNRWVQVPTTDVTIII